MALQPHSFVARLRDDAWVESASPPTRTRTLSLTFVEPAGQGIRLVKRFLAGTLKWIARGLYLSPLLLLGNVVIKAATRGPAQQPAHILMAVFVCMVVAFFAVLNVYIVVAVIAWRVTRRGSPTLRLPFTESGRDALQLLEGDAEDVPEDEAIPPPARSLLRVRGTVVELSPSRSHAGPILVDAWLTDKLNLGRITEATPFAIVSDGKLPVVVTYDVAPTFIATPEVRHSPAPKSSWTQHTQNLCHSLLASASGEELRLTLRAGDEVEVLGTVKRTIDNVDRVELGTETYSVPRPTTPGTPYRKSQLQPGVLLVAEISAPLTIRLLAHEEQLQPQYKTL